MKQNIFTDASFEELSVKSDSKEQMAEVANEEGSVSPSWGALLFKQTTEDVARAVAVAVNSPSSSVIYSSKDDSGGGQFQRLQHQVTKMIKGFSRPPDVNTNYNPEILTSLKRQWAANFQLQHMVSLLLKESFIDSFPYHDRSFMKLFVDTQLFSVYTDLILSFFQKE